jgi:CxxC motif-containing protein (DUF1111 family)
MRSRQLGTSPAVNPTDRSGDKLEHAQNSVVSQPECSLSVRFVFSGNTGEVAAREFAGEALHAVGRVLNLVFLQEREEYSKCAYSQTPEDTVDFEEGGFDDITLFAAFMRFLAPPAPAASNPEIAAGADIFRSVGCHLCHTPNLLTGDSALAPLRYKRVPLYSDLALHAMGPDLADGISGTGEDNSAQHHCGGWVNELSFYDGARDLVEAILAHSSQATASIRLEANEVFRDIEECLRRRRKAAHFSRSL